MKDIIDFLTADPLRVAGMVSTQWNITDNDNYWYYRGTNDILLVAHVDTVRKKQFKPLKLNTKNGMIRAENSILGADDRAGCYAISELHNKYGSQCSILLTNYEEIGGIGVKQFIDDFPALLSDYRLFLELDRMGIDEFVYYSHQIPKNLRKSLESFNFNEEFGCYSDVQDLTDHYNIAHANLSIGYYGHHTSGEYLDILALDNLLIPRISEMIEYFESTGETYIVEKSTNKLANYTSKYLKNMYTDKHWGDHCDDDDFDNPVNIDYDYLDKLDIAEELGQITRQQWEDLEKDHIQYGTVIKFKNNGAGIYG